MFFAEKSYGNKLMETKGNTFFELLWEKPKKCVAQVKATRMSTLNYKFKERHAKILDIIPHEALNRIFVALHVDITYTCACVCLCCM